MSIKITNELPPIVVPKILLPGDRRKQCCRVEANLEYHEVRKDVICHRCKVCGCRHFELNAEPGKFGLRGSNL